MAKDTWEDVQHHPSWGRCKPKIIRRYHYTPVRMTVVKDMKMLRSCGKTRTLEHCGWESNLLQPVGKTVPQEMKNRTATWPRYSTSEYSPEEHKNINPKTHMHPDLHCSIIYNSQEVANNLCPLTDKWICVCHIYCICICVTQPWKRMESWCLWQHRRTL